MNISKSVMTSGGINTIKLYLYLLAMSYLDVERIVWSNLYEIT